MAQLEEHPTVKHFREKRAGRTDLSQAQALDAAWLRQLCLDAGADDVGFVESDRPEIADQKAEIESVFPNTKTLISFVCRMRISGLLRGRSRISNSTIRQMKPMKWRDELYRVSKRLGLER